MPHSLRTKRRDYMRSRYKALKEKGLCTQCGKPAGGMGRCEVCRRYYARYRQACIDQAKCFGCAGITKNGRLFCKKCSIRKKKKAKLTAKERSAAGLCCCGRKKTDKKQKQCETCREKGRLKVRNLKIATFEAYGGAACSCCGEKQIQFLQLDHVDNDGAGHRKMRLMGSALYRALKKAGFPKGFQVLCANCNFAKGHIGYCPHYGP